MGKDLFLLNIEIYITVHHFTIPLERSTLSSRFSIYTETFMCIVKTGLLNSFNNIIHIFILTLVNKVTCNWLLSVNNNSYEKNFPSFEGFALVPSSVSSGTGVNGACQAFHTKYAIRRKIRKNAEAVTVVVAIGRLSL